MKKIFCIISAVFIGVIGVFLITLGCIRQRVVTFDNPFSINVYYKSTTTVNDGASYYEGDEGYTRIMEELNNSIRNSLLRVMISDGNLKNRPVYGEDNYSTYDTSMKNDNLVIELIYREENLKNIVCYEGDSSRVISYMCLIFIIPINSSYEEMVVYSSVTNDSTNKEKGYKDSTPFIVKGNPKKLIKYVESI